MSLLYNPSSLTNKNIDSLLSCVSVPLHRKNKLLGLIQMESVSGYSFTDYDRSQLIKAAQQISIAIDTLSFYQEPIQYYQKLILLAKFSQEFSKPLNQEKILQKAANAACSLFKSDHISIFFYDEASKSLKLAHSTKEKYSQENIPLDKSLEGEAFLKKKPVLLSHFPKTSPNTKNSGDLSCILCPISIPSYINKVSQKFIGIISVKGKKDDLSFSSLDLKILCFLAKQLGSALANASLYEKATIDSLTQLHSRGYFFQCLQEKILLFQQERKDLSLLMVDIDNFKKINDTYTHTKGDAILKQTGEFLKGLLAEGELLGRYGGEEFIMLLPMSHEKAMEKAQKIQKSVQNCFFWIDTVAIKITLSLGVSTLNKEDVCQSFVERADKALYLAKEKGKNQVVSEQEICFNLSY
ncbi:MAG: diguanylate cyclase, partial [Candidatus Brocadiae bacterium]|nr:diguanylate cyclase [Candidatus Brocadiia bacterium]